MSAAIARKLAEAGLDAAAIVAALEAFEAVEEERKAAKREGNRERQQRRRDRSESRVTPRDGELLDVTERDPFFPSEVSPHTPLPTNQSIQVPPYSPPKSRRAKQAVEADPAVEAVVERVWRAGNQTARDRSSRKDVRKAVEAAMGQGATPEALEASVARLSEAKGEFANGAHILVSGEHWRDEQAPAQADEPDPWAFRLEVWTRDRSWRETWGPPPGKPGYRGPQEASLAA